MADDIDIEEHSLMEDADVSGIFPDFPDLDVVKTEVIDIEDGFEDQRHNDVSIASTSVIPDSTTDVDYQPPRTTDSPHIISSTSIPEDPEEITDRLNIEDLVKNTETTLCYKDADVNISIREDGLTEELDVSGDETNNDVSINEKPVVNNGDNELVDVINDKDAGNDEAFFGNCIILGSKTADVNREDYYEDEKCFNSFVALDDWGPYLNGSDCYCSECEILFATVNALDFHKMQAHSHLVAVFGGDEDAYASDDSPKDDSVKAACSLCSSVLASKTGLKKHMKLMHNPNSIPPVRNNIILGTKKVTTEANLIVKTPLRTYAVKRSATKPKNVDVNTIKSAFVCFVCQFQCSSDDELIDHLYKLHTFRCESCNAVFAKKDEYDVHMLTHNPQLSIKQQKTEKAIEIKQAPSKRKRSVRPGGSMVRRCDGCPAQYAKMPNLIKHYMTFKLKWKEPLVANQEFDPVCPVCSTEITHRKRFNDHVAAHDLHGKSDFSRMQVTKCKFCPAQFCKSRLAMYHSESVHKIVIYRKPVRRKVFNPRCPHCSESFAFPGLYNKHLQTQHSIDTSAKPKGLRKDVASETFPSPLKLPLQTSSKVSFKCLKCDVSFPDLTAANNHKESAHARFNGDILRKVTNQIALIQTNFLFRCATCDVHFTSPSQAQTHANSNCKDQTSSLPCKQCELKINITDVALHNKKHDINDELTIIDVSESDLNVRILCKCPSCRFHFNECDYHPHYVECSSHSLIPYWCVFCNLYIDIKAQTSHDRFHYELKLEKEELIILEYKEIVKSSMVEDIAETDNAVDKDQKAKRLLNAETIRMEPMSKEYSDKMSAIKSKTQGIYKLIECTFCETFRTFHYDSALNHLDGECKRKVRRPCNLCGLRVLNITSAIHKGDHRSHPNLNIRDTLFFDESLNVIKPRIPKLFKCQQCFISFESKYHLDRHTCGKSKGQRCVQCKTDIVKTYYPFHLQYHEYKLPKLSGLEYAAPRYEKNINCEKDSVHKQGTSKSEYHLDDHSDKQNKAQTKPKDTTFYQNFKPNTKIILYQCQKCKMSSVSVSFREVHKSCTTNSFTCRLCNLKFADTYRVRHAQFHLNHPDANFDSYQITEFDHEELSKGTVRTEDKRPLNGPITNKNKQLLKSRGLAVFYQCAKCKLVSIGRRFFLRHKTCVKYANPHSCEICGYSCAPHYADSHIRWHKYNPNVKKEQIIISPFKPGFGVVSTTAKQMVKLKPTNNESSIVQKRPEPDISVIRNVKPEGNSNVKHEVSTRKTKMFQCNKCGICSVSLAFPHGHNDCKNIKSFDCEKCGMKFFETFKKSHREFHIKSPKATVDYFNFIRFDPETVFRPISYTKWSELSKLGKVVLIQCVQCKLASTSRQIIHNHLTCDSTLPFYNCKLCGYKLIMSEKQKHIVTHMNRPQLKRSDIIVSQFDPKIERQLCQVDDDEALLGNDDMKVKNEQKYIIFRCDICDVCTEEGTDHECKEGIKKLVCGICSLTFEDVFYSKHSAKHSDPNYSKNVQVIHIEGETPSHYRKRKFLPSDETPTKMPRLSEVSSSEASFTGDDSADGLDKIFKCPCGLHFLKRVSFSNHTRTCNRDHNSQITNVCKYCNISLHTLLSLKDHISRHHDGKIDFKVISLTESKNTNSNLNKSRDVNATPLKAPRLSKVASSEASFVASDNDDDCVDKIIKCPCELHFLSRMSCNNHIRACNRDQPRQSFNVCNYCNISLHSSKSLEEHISRHHDGNIAFKIINYNEVINKKINIYKCRDCNLFFPTFEEFKSIAHVETCGVSTGVTCTICKFEIMESFVNEHAKIHAVGKPRRADKFNVVVVSRDLIPTNIPAPNSILYLCTKCDVHFLNTDGLECHYPCENSSRRHTKCPECGLKFYSASLYAHVSAQHTKYNYDINDLFIKKVDPKEDPAKEVNPNIEVAPESDDDSKLDESDSISKQNPSKRHTLYQCNKCKVHFVYTKTVYNHKLCSISNPAANFTCEECNMIIYSPEKDVHFHLHHSEENNLTCESDYVIHKKNSYQNGSTTRKAAEKYPVFGCRSVKGAVKSSYRPSKGIAKSRKIVGEDEPNVIYKCYECDLCFICKGSILKHSPKYAAHESAKNKMPCDVCGLQFGPWILKQHKIIHHDELNFKLEDFKILTIEDVRNETVQQSDVTMSESDTTINSSLNDSVNTSISKTNNIVTGRKSTGLSEPSKTAKEWTPGPSTKLDEHNKVKLYKCKDCNVNFLKQNLCYRHVINHEPLSTFDFLECKICTLNFPLQYLQQHMAQHKKEEFGLKDILIEEYEPIEQTSPGSKRSTPKIDIYNAIDREDKNMIKAEENASSLTKEHESSNAKPEISNTETDHNEINKDPVEADAGNEKNEPCMLQRLLESENVVDYERSATSSSVECKDIKKESETSDGDARCIGSASKDDNSLQSMDIETDFNDAKILNNLNEDAN